eukprot:223780-Chlamydomonas_euryale.AAC.2
MMQVVAPRRTLPPAFLLDEIHPSLLSTWQWRAAPHPYPLPPLNLARLCARLVDWLRQDGRVLLPHHRDDAHQQLPAYGTQPAPRDALCAHPGAHARADVPDLRRGAQVHVPDGHPPGRHLWRRARR